MAHKQNKVIKVKTQICNEQLYVNTDLQNIKEEDCSTEDLSEPCAYQEYCETIYIKEKLENNILLTDEHRNIDSNEGIPSTIFSNLRNKEEILKTEVNDYLGSSYGVESNSCKVEITEDNLALTDNLINSNTKSTDLMLAEKGDVELLSTEDHLTNVNTIENKPINTIASRTADLNNEDREETTQDARNKAARNKSHVCNICDKAYSTIGNLTQHTRTHTSEESYDCDVCHKKCKRSSSLVMHKRSHTINKTYVCDVCQNKFNTSYRLSIHRRTHTGEKPHACDMCPKTFITSSALIVHKRTHTGEKSYVCDVCYRACSTSSNLSVHKLTHTGEKSYVCDVCHRACSTSYNLAVHKRSHTGEMSYVCDVCSRTFSTASNLLTHQHTHTGEKPYVCYVCHKAYNRSSSLVRHALTHTD